MSEKIPQSSTNRNIKTGLKYLSEVEKSLKIKAIAASVDKDWKDRSSFESQFDIWKSEYNVNSKFIQELWDKYFSGYTKQTPEESLDVIDSVLDEVASLRKGRLSEKGKNLSDKPQLGKQTIQNVPPLREINEHARKNTIEKLNSRLEKLHTFYSQVEEVILKCNKSLTYFESKAAIKIFNNQSKVTQTDISAMVNIGEGLVSLIQPIGNDDPYIKSVRETIQAVFVKIDQIFNAGREIHPDEAVKFIQYIQNFLMIQSNKVANKIVEIDAKISKVMFPKNQNYSQALPVRIQDFRYPIKQLKLTFLPDGDFVFYDGTHFKETASDNRQELKHILTHFSLHGGDVDVLELKELHYRSLEIIHSFACHYPDQFEQLRERIKIIVNDHAEIDVAQIFSNSLGANLVLSKKMLQEVFEALFSFSEIVQPTKDK